MSLSPDKVSKIRLLLPHHSHREIARIVGCDRKTVDKLTERRRSEDPK
jgi:DNA-directed RNA polymerase specialized sigma24 family protein